MSNIKIKKLVNFQGQVMGAWLQYLNSLGKFQCMVSKNKTVVNETGAHIVGEKQGVCESFHRDVECDNKTCPHKSYNTGIVTNFNMVKNARHERNLAFWDVLGMKEFIINRTLYKDIKRQVRKQKGKVESLRGRALDASEFITAVPVNHDGGAVKKSKSRSHCLIMNPHDNWSKDFCDAFSEEQYCKRILLTAKLMAESDETPKDTIDRIMNYSCMVNPYQHIQYAKMCADTVVPTAEKDGIKYVDFSKIDTDGKKHWISMYESLNKQWIESGIINLTENNGYVPIEQSILGVSDLNAYHGGRVFWNAEHQEFVACPICAGFMANMAYIDGKADLASAEETYNSLLEERRAMRNALCLRRARK